MTTTVNLKFIDRIALINCLPAQGNIDTLVIADEVIKMVDIGPDEQKLASMKRDAQGNVTWNPAADNSKEYTFDNAQTTLIRDTLEARNTQKSLTRDFIHLYAVMSKGASK